MLSCYFVIFLINASGAFQISAPLSVKSEASLSVVWNHNDGDPDDSVFARRLLPAEVGDQLPESPGSLLSGTIDVEFPVPGVYLIEIRTPQPEFRLLAETGTITTEPDASDSNTSESAIATSSSISSTVPVPVPSSSATKSVQSPTSSVSSHSHVLQIIGGTLGSFLSVILLTVLFIFYRRRRLWRPSSQSLDIEKRNESETPSPPESMDQPLTKPESHASMLTSAYSPRISQRSFYLSYTDGFLRRLDSDPHRHERAPTIASSGISPRLTSRQFLLHERAGSLLNEADWSRQTISSTPRNDLIVGELRTTIWRREEHVHRLEVEHQLDEPPPVYMENTVQFVLSGTGVHADTTV